MSKALQRKLKKTREALGLTQKAMAGKLVVPLRTLIAWENDERTPRGFALAALNTALDNLMAEARNSR